MFSGIVQGVGKVIHKEKRGGQERYTFEFNRKQASLKKGASVAVDGVCLTAARVGARTFQADVMKETLTATTLGRLKKNDRVNLERALCLGDEIGGHFVTGHVDGAAVLLRIDRDGKNRSYTFRVPEGLLPYISVKGSLTVDGVSLTVQRVKGDQVTVCLIPHTLKATNLGGKKTGDRVNLEVDLIARYLDQLNSKRPRQDESRRLLKKMIREGF